MEIIIFTQNYSQTKENLFHKVSVLSFRSDELLTIIIKWEK